MRMYRASGSPVRVKDHELYSIKVNEAMDKAEERFGKCNAENAKEFSEFVEQEHRELTKLYPIYIKTEFPSTQKEMLSMIEHYGTAIAFCEEEGKLVAYIMDRA